MRGLLLFHLQDVIAELGLDQSDVCPGRRVNAAWSNSGTVAPRFRKPSSPPWSLLPGSSEFSFASSAKLPPALICFEDVFRLGLGRRIGLGICAVRLDQDVAHLDLFIDLIVLLMLGVILLDFRVSDLRSAAWFLASLKAI